jgi:hypothetical protein
MPTPPDDTEIEEKMNEALGAVDGVQAFTVTPSSTSETKTDPLALLKARNELRRQRKGVAASARMRFGG